MVWFNKVIKKQAKRVSVSHKFKKPQTDLIIQCDLFLNSKQNKKINYEGMKTKLCLFP